MANFDSGVSGYIHARAVVDVFFPVDARGSCDINCMQCKFYARSSGICLLTKEVSEYPTRYTGSHCPLDYFDEIKEVK